MARERSRRGGSTADEAPPPDYLADLPWWRRALPWTLATAFLIVYVLFLANDFWVGVMALGLTLSLIFLSFVVVTGMGGHGQPGAGHVRPRSPALTAGLLINRYEWSMLPATLVGVAVAVLLGLIVALPALRLGGLPFALATLALGLPRRSGAVPVGLAAQHAVGLDDPAADHRSVRHEQQQDVRHVRADPRRADRVADPQPQAFVVGTRRSRRPARRRSPRTRRASRCCG